MTARIFFLLAGTALLTPLLALRPASSAKCGQTTTTGETLVAIDGAFVAGGEAALKGLQREAIYSVQVVCMNPEDSTFNRRAGVPLISVWTREGPVASLHATLRRLPAAQAAHRERTGRYSEDVAALGVAVAPRLRVALQVLDGDWVARGTIERLMETCVISGRAATGNVQCTPD